MKVVTICGSLKFIDDMIKIAEEYALKGYCVLTPVYPSCKDYKRTDKELEYLKNAHFKKIDMSDSIIVVNKDNYIGSSTKLEIDYALNMNKEVIYYYGNNN